MLHDATDALDALQARIDQVNVRLAPLEHELNEAEMRATPEAQALATLTEAA